jgi:predicted esterase
MAFLSFDEVQAELQRLYGEQAYQEALELATRQLDSFPEGAPLLHYWRMTMAARTGNPALTLAILGELNEGGFWFGENLIRRSPSFKGLQGLPEFERQAGVNAGLREADKSRTYPLLILRSQGRCGAGDAVCPLMLALHANASTAQDSLDFWRPAAIAGWLVAAPQSSQAMWKGAYVWDDREITEREVKKHYASLIEQYSVDRDRVALAGHSLGGEMAIYLALTEAIPARGFVAFGPGGPLMDDLDSWDQIIQEYANPKLRGYIIVGEEDSTIPQDNIEELVRLFNLAGMAVELEVVANVGHDYAPQFESALGRALAYLQTG